MTVSELIALLSKQDGGKQVVIHDWDTSQLLPIGRTYDHDYNGNPLFVLEGQIYGRPDLGRGIVNEDETL